MGFPSTIDSFPALVDNVDTMFAVIPNARGTSITSIETALGVNFANLAVIGEVRMWAGTIASIPTGWLHCGGQTLLKASYPALYALIGSQYGTETATQFIMPDTRDRFVVGASQDTTLGVAVSNITGAPLKTGGSKVTSTFPTNSGLNSGGNAVSGSHGHAFYPPYVALTFIIKALPYVTTLSDIDIYITLVDNVDIVRAAHHNERAQAIIDIETALGINIVSAKITGEVKGWGGTLSNMPSGWLFCDGSAVSRTTYASLFAVISTQYGAGDGSTTFNLPDLRDKFVIGTRQDSAGAAKTNITGTLTKTGGSTSQPPVTQADGNNGLGNSGGEEAISSHMHTFVPPYTAAVFMIKT
jgi:microcystin-dependent protein